jgi:hypothetical protein
MLTLETFALASLLLDRRNTRWKKLCPTRKTTEGIASLAGALLAIAAVIAVVHLGAGSHAETSLPTAAAGPTMQGP